MFRAAGGGRGPIPQTSPRSLGPFTPFARVARCFLSALESRAGPRGPRRAALGPRRGTRDAEPCDASFAPQARLRLCRGLLSAGTRGWPSGAPRRFARGTASAWALPPGSLRPAPQLARPPTVRFRPHVRADATRGGDPGQGAQARLVAATWQVAGGLPAPRAPLRALSIAFVAGDVAPTPAAPPARRAKWQPPSRPGAIPRPSTLALARRGPCPRPHR